MLEFALKRLGLTLLVLVSVSVITFALVRLAGDPAGRSAGAHQDGAPCGHHQLGEARGEDGLVGGGGAVVGPRGGVGASHAGNVCPYSLPTHAFCPPPITSGASPSQNAGMSLIRPPHAPRGGSMCAV